MVKATPLVDNVDICRAAELPIERHGDDAPIHAAMRADELMDQEGRAVWLRIKAAVEEMLRTERAGLRIEVGSAPLRKSGESAKACSASSCRNAGGAARSMLGERPFARQTLCLGDLLLGHVAGDLDTKLPRLGVSAKSR